MEFRHLITQVLNQEVVGTALIFQMALVLPSTSLDCAEGLFYLKEFIALGFIGGLAMSVLFDLDAKLLQVERLLLVGHNLELVEGALPKWRLVHE